MMMQPQVSGKSDVIDYLAPGKVKSHAVVPTGVRVRQVTAPDELTRVVHTLDVTFRSHDVIRSSGDVIRGN